MISARKGKLLSFQYFCALHLRWISCYFIFLLLIHHKNDFKCKESPSNQPSSGQLQKARPQPGEQWHWGSGVTIPAAHLEAGDKWDAFPVMAFYSALINTALAWVFPRSNVNPKLSCIKAQFGFLCIAALSSPTLGAQAHVLLWALDRNLDLCLISHLMWRFAMKYFEEHREERTSGSQSPVIWGWRQQAPYNQSFHQGSWRPPGWHDVFVHKLDSMMQEVLSTLDSSVILSRKVFAPRQTHWCAGCCIHGQIISICSSSSVVLSLK